MKQRYPVLASILCSIVWLAAVPTNAAAQIRVLISGGFRAPGSSRVRGARSRLECQRRAACAIREGMFRDEMCIVGQGIAVVVEQL